MTIYSRAFTVTASTEQEFTLSIEGDVITYVRIRFPPGPSGLLGVSIFYGVKQIFPYEENTDFRGDDEIIDWQEYWELPEEQTTLKIKAKNEATAYDHTFYLVINVQRKEHTLASLIAKALIRGIRRLFGVI